MAAELLNTAYVVVAILAAVVGTLFVAAVRDDGFDAVSRWYELSWMAVVLLFVVGLGLAMLT